MWGALDPAAGPFSPGVGTFLFSYLEDFSRLELDDVASHLLPVFVQLRLPRRFEEQLLGREHLPRWGVCEREKMHVYWQQRRTPMCREAVPSDTRNAQPCNRDTVA
jgi:hypothetical protein